jgi:hypothetical protein
MKKILFFIQLFFCLSIYSQSTSYFEKSTGLKGSYHADEKVFKASIPLEHTLVTIHGRPLDPFMGLTSWAAFAPQGDQYMVMGDLVLLENQVNPVISTLFNHQINVTALHNHFFYDQPRVFFLHIMGEGSLENLGKGVRNALKTAKKIKTTSKGEQLKNLPNSISVHPLEKIFGIQGEQKSGMIKFIFGRKIRLHGTEFGKEMGINTWVAFGGSDEHAIVDGDFAVTEVELQNVLRSLREGNIQIVAIHNHMTFEEPRILFIHFWGTGSSENLAKAIKAAISKTGVKH